MQLLNDEMKLYEQKAKATARSAISRKRSATALKEVTEMNIPRFTAEASIYVTGHHYSAIEHGTPKTVAAQPQMVPAL